jgi:hypothetical protein
MLVDPTPTWDCNIPSARRRTKARKIDIGRQNIFIVSLIEQFPKVFKLLQ